MQGTGKERVRAHTACLLLADACTGPTRTVSSPTITGIFATKDFAQGDVIFREAPLVGMQHTSSSQEATICAHSRAFVGARFRSVVHSVHTHIYIYMHGHDANTLESYDALPSYSVETFLRRACSP